MTAAVSLAPIFEPDFEFYPVLAIAPVPVVVAVLVVESIMECPEAASLLLALRDSDPGLILGRAPPASK